MHPQHNLPVESTTSFAAGLLEQAWLHGICLSEPSNRGCFRRQLSSGDGPAHGCAHRRNFCSKSHPRLNSPTLKPLFCLWAVELLRHAMPLPPAHELDEHSAGSLKEALRTLQRAFAEGAGAARDFPKSRQVPPAAAADTCPRPAGRGLLLSKEGQINVCNFIYAGAERAAGNV